MLRGPEGAAPTWLVPALLVATGAAPLLLFRRTECLSLPNGTPTPDQICDAGSPAGAWVFAGVCWLAALVVWLAARQDRMR